MMKSVKYLRQINATTKHPGWFSYSLTPLAACPFSSSIYTFSDAPTTTILHGENAINGKKLTVLRRKMASSCGSGSKRLVAISEARRFMIDCFKHFKVSTEHAEANADILVGADQRGHLSHGMNRLEMYLNELETGMTDGKAMPVILNETIATAWVDGKNGMGVIVGNYCMDLAIKKAGAAGVGWVCAKGSNHYGMSGWYPLRAMRQGFLGLTMTNSSPLMAPTRSKSAALGTNPISMGAPAKDDHFLLDMAMTAVAMGKIEMQVRKNQPLPPGWAQGPDGNETTDAELAFKTACLMPLGGGENTAGHKGYALAAMVDIMSAVLPGANYSTKVRGWKSTEPHAKANLGHLFVAINPNCFGPNFEDRMLDFNTRMRCCEPKDPARPVLVPGEVDAQNMCAVEAAGGIEYVENQLKSCEKLAQRLKIKPLSFVKI